MSHVARARDLAAAMRRDGHPRAATEEVARLSARARRCTDPAEAASLSRMAVAVWANTTRRSRVS